MSGAPLDARRAYLQELGAAHGFTLEELGLNREGRVHPAQVSRGRSSGIGGSAFAVVLGLVFAAAGVGGAVYLYDDYQKPISDTDMNGIYALGVGGMVLCMLFMGGAVLGFRKVAQRRSAYERGPILVEGPLRKVHIDGRGGVPSQWRYVIGGVTFQVSQRAWSFTTQGAQYRAYHVAGDLLSIEPL